MVVVEEVKPDQIMPLLVAAWSEKLDSSGKWTPELIAGLGQAFALKKAGEIIGCFVASKINQGFYVWAAASQKKLKIDMSELLTIAIEDQAKIRGCGSVTFRTQRSGLIEKMKKQGYKIKSAEMGKAL